jgi:hypothetical protein
MLLFKNSPSVFPSTDFSTHAYQQNFHVAPDPKKIIQLGVSGKQGRYVRIQLLDSHQAPCS